MAPDTVTFLFTDIEGSTRLWEQQPVHMRAALARHDAIAREAVETNRGTVVKMIGDGVHAAFDQAIDAVRATIQLQTALADPAATHGVVLSVRCGLHLGPVERRDSDFFGSAVNRAARIMAAAHGGQVLLSNAVAVRVAAHLPDGVTLRGLGRARLRDLASPEQMHQLVHPALRKDFPALRTLEATPNNLAQQVTSFVGRERELAQVKALLATTRLMTVLGAGGIGKTRLSQQVAADVIDDYADGVWFVDLASLTDTRLVADAVASVLGVKEEAGRPVVDALLKHVRDRCLLLILDNSEHLVDACATIAKQLLQAGPQVKVLASSRESLHVFGETVFAVPALAAPDPHAGLDPAALADFAAVRLFIERAVAVQSGFRLTGQNAGAVAEICHRLDGIPLAIELAAARVSALSVDQIAVRLNDRFRLLTRGDRTAMPRQQTLRASIDWSYDLLSGLERTLLCRLAVFAGGWTIEAAEAVGAEDEVRREAVLELLTRLVEQSLVALAADGERYRLLHTVRQYSLERLASSGAEGDARTRHLGFYVSLLERADQGLQGPEQGAWLARVGIERENVLLAHAWCDRAEDGAELGLRLVHSAELYWSYRGVLELGYRVTVEALARQGAQSPTLIRCHALATAVNLAYFMGRYVEACRYCEEALSIARDIGEKKRIAGTLQLLGRVLQAQGELGAAQPYLEEALALARASGDRARVAGALNALAELYRANGDLAAAGPLYQESLALRRQLGDGSNVAVNLLNLVMVSIGLGALDDARPRLIEALTVARETGSTRMGQAVLEVTASLAVALGQWQPAARLYGAAEAELERMKLHREQVDEASVQPLITRTRLALGAEDYAEMAARGHRLGYADALMEAQSWLSLED